VDESALETLFYVMDIMDVMILRVARLAMGLYIMILDGDGRVHHDFAGVYMAIIGFVLEVGKR